MRQNAVLCGNGLNSGGKEEHFDNQHFPIMFSIRLKASSNNRAALDLSTTNTLIFRLLFTIVLLSSVKTQLKSITTQYRILTH